MGDKMPNDQSASVKAFIERFDASKMIPMEKPPTNHKAAKFGSPENVIKPKPVPKLIGVHGVAVMPSSGQLSKQLNKPKPAPKRIQVPPKQAIMPDRNVLVSLKPIPAKTKPNVAPRKPPVQLVKPVLKPLHQNKENGADVKVSGVNAIKQKLLEMEKNSLNDKNNNNENKDKDNRAKRESTSSDKKIYGDPCGKQYRILKLPDQSGQPPQKPNLPYNIDLYEYLVGDDDDDLYQEYDDVVVPTNNVPAASNQPAANRAVSMIPLMTSDDENEHGEEQDTYDDTLLEPRTPKTDSYITEEIYDSLSD